MFQSTPAIAGGRIYVGSAMHLAVKGFQSTPAIAGGRILDALQTRELSAVVSIHARHCWRANLEFIEFLYATGAVSIHARHCWRANLRRVPR